ncbi:O-antigen ligase family protein [Rubripirellula reticaptiva]|uniref:O-Antigen ligase n=1 Tax=Rubripirellula reticaptiva TaxID=2528013 RepID=A0A5C6EDV4_9BACT|nr:O-antigen ligase family protein [Rubripirellula reticaptiva]TWU47913.1 O-Antigen ligase [Rubripirellula reticaptiva]
MEFLIAMFCVASLVWLVPVLQSARLVIIAMLVLGVGTVFGPAFFAINGPIQISLDRVLWGAMFGVAAIGWRTGALDFPKLTRIDWMVVGIVGWFFVRTIGSGVVPDGSSPTARWLFYIAMPAGMYAIARLVEIRQQDVRLLTMGGIGLGLYLAITAVLEVTSHHAFVFPHYIVDGEVWEFFGRGRGPLLNPSGNGFVISVGVAAASIGFVYAPRRAKLVYAAIVGVLLMGVYATLTRSAWMGGIGAVGLVALVYSPRWVRVLGLMGVLLLGGASVMGLKDQLVQMKRDKNLSAADAQKSMALRPLLAVVAYEMFKDKPIVGHGFGRYYCHNAPYHSDRSYELPLEIARPYNQHNVFLSVLVDTGLVGLSLFGGWIVCLIGTGWRLVREPAKKPEARFVGLILLGTMIAYFANGMFQDVLIIPMVHMFLFFLGGIAVTVRQKGVLVEVPGTKMVPVIHPSRSMAIEVGNGVNS